MVYLTSFNRLVEQGVSKEPTPCVLPLPVIHTNSLSGTKVLAFRSFLQKNQAPIYSDFELKNSFLIQTPRGSAWEFPTRTLLVFPSLTNPDLGNHKSNCLTLRPIRFSPSQLLRTKIFLTWRLGFWRWRIFYLSQQGGWKLHKWIITWWLNLGA